MIPSYHNLAGCAGRSITWNIGGARLPDYHGSCEISIPVDLDADGDEFALNARQGGDGIWIPYLERTATYAFAAAGVQWAATGPFSGCRLEIGTHDGRLYAAHIAFEKGYNATGELDLALPGRQIIKTVMPTGIKLAALLGDSFMGLAFVVWNGQDLDATQLTYRVMGDDHEIVNVSRIPL